VLLPELDEVWLRFLDGRPGQRGHHHLPPVVLRGSGDAREGRAAAALG